MQVIRKIIIKDPTGKTISLGEFAIMTVAQVLLENNNGQGGKPTANVEFADGTLTLTLGNIQGVGIADIVQKRQSDQGGGINEWEIQLTDGRATRLILRNGYGIVGPQGPKGDTVLIGDGQTYTLYNDTDGDNVDGAMTQRATKEYMDGRFVQVADTADMMNRIATGDYNENTFYYTIEEEEE